MAALFKVGSFQLSALTAGNTIAVTGVGFQPTGVVLLWSGVTGSADAISAASFPKGYGAFTGPTARWAVAGRAIDNSSNASTAHGNRNDACYARLLTGGSFSDLVDVQSMDADGFTLIVDVDVAADYRVDYIAFGGDVQCEVGSFTPTGTAPTTQAVTLAMGDATAVIFAGAGLAAANAGGLDSSVFLGAMSGASGEGVTLSGSDSGQGTMVTRAYCKAGECIARFDTSAAIITDRAEFSSFTGGFVVNWLERANAGVIYYLALKGVNAVVGDLLTQTDTTTPIAESGFGFAPAAVLFSSACRAQSTADTPTNHDMFTIGVATSTSARRSMGHWDENGTANSETAFANESDAVYINISAADAIQGLMDVQSFDSDGFTMIMDDADPAQSFVWYLALGPLAVTGRLLTRLQTEGLVIGSGGMAA